MTLNDAIITSLEEIKTPANYLDVYKRIKEKNYYDFKDAKTPASTVSALLGNFIRNRDSRVKRIPQKGGDYTYFLTKFESEISIEALESVNSIENASASSLPVTAGNRSFDERSLHKLLSSFLNSTGVYSKTIFHEQSNSKDSHQKWIHPDMIGIRFLNLHTQTSLAFLKAINRLGTFELTAYEIKKEIKTDYELKKCFFQAVSNSSWANYGYLVTFELSDVLMDEVKRLNQAFGIGIIRLSSNPFESEIVLPAKYKDLDFVTIDKLCKINPEFERFVEQVEKYITADAKYISALNKELANFCDPFFVSETESEAYCKEKNIPLDNPVEENLLGNFDGSKYH
ncbi:hypothetical protein SAMN05444266_102453 [Chitinophaga jiangningensis]|uniref:HTH HARE-type domain-containing protein n=1 Tax=Chitinophaga jiangningensis TaxID=1419482 RepID=A0A1M6YRJ1_9BACT|nr:hypothetical protein [Chitinophaga jiangningensis]SHL20896.1 hypothetical protein SAMN05444266_102453 [Chitinophaga jiangningensis]